MKSSLFASWCRRFRRRLRRPRKSEPPIRVSRQLPRDPMNDAVSTPQAAASVRLGLKENWPQFALLVLINAFVGGMVGIERTVVPLIGAEEFRIGSTTLVVSFIVSFGVVKACANLVSGQLADAWGRKRVLILGWLVATGTVHDHLGTKLEMGDRGECPARHQPGLRLVDDGHYEDRPRRPEIARAGGGPQRVRRLSRRRRDRLSHWIHRLRVWPTAGAHLSRCCLRDPGLHALDSIGARHT